MTVLTYESPEAGATYRNLVATHGSPLFVVDLTAIRAAYRSFQANLPSVRPYYAVKALSEPRVIATLNELGAGFDLASAGEVNLVQALGVNPRRTIHTHPIKSDAEIRAALRYGATTFVVDNPFELQKFVRYRRRVALLIRVGFRSDSAVVDLARKFGCAPDQVAAMLTQASSLGLRVKGLSFHVGSQVENPAGHVAAIRAAADLIERAEAASGIPMSVLDIGGGFPVNYGGGMVDAMPEGSRPDNSREMGSEGAAAEEAFFAPIRSALERVPAHLEIIAEPGRVLVASAGQVVTTVIGKATRGTQTWFYLDEGVYGAFSGQIYDHARYPLTVFGGQPVLTQGVLAGPTCDSIDVLAEDVPMPDLGLGDLVVGRQMGAYTVASASEFNLLARAKTIVTDSESTDNHASVHRGR